KIWNKNINPPRTQIPQKPLFLRNLCFRARAIAHLCLSFSRSFFSKRGTASYPHTSQHTHFKKNMQVWSLGSEALASERPENEEGKASKTHTVRTGKACEFGCFSFFFFIFSKRGTASDPKLQTDIYFSF